jgi:hypothetical protein
MFCILHSISNNASPTIMTYKYTISDKGSNSKRSNDWENAIKFAIELAKENVGNIISIKHYKGHTGASFVWSVEHNDLIPAW